MSSLAMDTACSKFRIFLVDFLELQEANGHILHGKKVHPIIQIKSSLEQH
jgi:hypothetical protein